MFCHKYQQNLDRKNVFGENRAYSPMAPSEKLYNNDNSIKFNTDSISHFFRLRA